jgi:hypothetical protein
MNVKKTPLMVVNDEHGGKTKLVDKIMGLIERDEDEDKDSLKARLMKASNKKLLRLASVSQTIREKYGSTEKLVEFVAGKLNRAKDSDFVTRLAVNTPARILDLARSLSGEPRRAPKFGNARPVEKRAAPVKAKAKVATKASAKKGPAKKAPSKPAAKKAPARKSAKS